MERDVEVVVIGAGQAGLSAGYHLARQGFAPGTGFVVLDGEVGAGGAWQHRWPSLTLARTHHVHDLPGLPFPDRSGRRHAASHVRVRSPQHDEVATLLRREGLDVAAHGGELRVRGSTRPPSESWSAAPACSCTS